jgi:hypothetical protein
LLIAIEPQGVDELKALAAKESFTITEIGFLTAKSGDFYIEVI